MLGQERNCDRIARGGECCEYHIKQKVKSFPCKTCGKGTRSKYGTCYKKGCDYEKLRHINKMVRKTKEREDCLITKHYKKKLHEELIKKVKTTYQIINQIFFLELLYANNYSFLYERFKIPYYIRS